MDTQEKTNYDKQAIIRELMGDDEDKLFETLENFSEMLMRYNSAIREIRTKFEVLNDDLSLRNSRNPIESISSRVKKPISIAKKLKRMGYPVTVESIRDNLNDVAGVRVICSFVDDIYSVAEMLAKQDDIEDPLPFDLNAPVVEIRDEDYALFYRDITEEPKKYAGKTVKFKGQVARLRREKEGMFAPGRFVMTCCEADITFMGLPCKFAAASGLAARSWVWVTATVEVKFHTLYKGVGPILTAVNVQPAEPAEQNVATF